ncbi:MAG TPA: ATP-binding protein, partial [Marmoricola sp.]
GDGPEPPSPGLVDIPALMDRARATGVDVTYRDEVSSDGIGAGTQLAIYRVVQESLTNVVKHAPGSAVDVALVEGAGEVRLTVRNHTPESSPAPIDSGGHGLVGMRERAAAYGGRCTAGFVEPGVFEVRLDLPVERGTEARR